MESCYRHPGVQTGITCQRCGRPICTECAREAAVGFQCPECRIRQLNAARESYKASLKAGMTQPLNQREMARRMIGSQLTTTVERAPVTFTLIGITVVAFFGQLITQYGMGDDVLMRYGGFVPLLTTFEPWRILTSAFLHVGVGHILFNMLALYMFGQILEPILGSLRFTGLYLVSAVFGALGPILTSFVWPDDIMTMSVGASGAVFGLFGAMFVVQRHIGMDTAPLLVLLGINFAYSFIASNIAWQAHISGLIGGAIMIGIYMLAGRTSRKRQTQIIIDSVVTIATIAVVVGVEIVLVHQILAPYLIQ